MMSCSAGFCLLLTIGSFWVQSLSASPYVVVKNVKEWLDVVDSDHDQHLSRSELFDAIKKHHDEHLDRMDMVHHWTLPNWIDKHDTMDGWDMADFLALRVGEQPDAKDSKFIRQEMDIFKKADTNNNNILEKEEYVNLLKGYGDQHLKEQLADLEFSKADSNNDKKLSYVELMEHMKPKSDFHEEKLAEIFDKVDADSDHYLNMEELRPLHNQVLQDHLDHDVDHFMEVTDDNRDAKISLDELRKHTDDITNLWTRSDDDEALFQFIRDDEE